MITNGTAEPQNYYRIQLSSEPMERYAYGATALEAIQTVRDDLWDAGFLFLGNATARLAVYKEWIHGTERFTNGGDFIR